MKHYFFVLVFVFQFSVIFPDTAYFNFFDLEYGITKEDVIQKCGSPTKVESKYMDEFYYDFQDCEIVLNFFTDDSLSYIYQKNKNGNIFVIKELKHSFFTNSEISNKFDKSGKDSEEFLLNYKFIQKYFYFNQLLTEVRLLKELDKDFKIIKIEYFTRLSDRIVFTYYSLNGNAPHCICAYILTDEPISEKEKMACQIGFIKYDKNNDNVIDEDEGDWFNNRYVLTVDETINLDELLEWIRLL